MTTGLLAVLALGAVAPGAHAGFGFADLRVSMTGPAGPLPKGEEATYTTTVTNQGDAASEPLDSVVHLSSYRADGERPVNNPYVSATPSQGSCTPSNFDSSFGTYYGQECSLGSIAPGASATVTSVVTLNEAMDHNSYVHGGTGGQATVTTLVDSPPTVTGSEKIKLSGLPDACASKDFTMKAKAGGAKKITVQQRGPLQSTGNPISGEFPKNKKIAVEKGGKAKVPVDAGSLEPGYWELKIVAKFDGKPKQTTLVLFQRCP